MAPRMRRPTTSTTDTYRPIILHNETPVNRYTVAKIAIGYMHWPFWLLLFMEYVPTVLSTMVSQACILQTGGGYRASNPLKLCSVFF